ncbi:DUF2948 family protein [Roseitranquillus sediminis]|uniref:DUF2948 family protein n=1 Tax=Roseitranquillus sediminis TaxID=2809051 RepID=UPI001D0C3B40|nr:DUF2948 family protein [Roseitranquillus sediminis]MBM9594225.1 DUF2948 family protein [Roseitranquillus sediminis]
MTEDARFEDADPRGPLRLRALDEDDLRVLSSLVQDAVVSRRDLTWQKSQRRFAMLLNRFRWEDIATSERRQLPAERVRTMLVVEDVERVASAGLDEADGDTPLCLLAIQWQPGEDGAGILTFPLAGGGAIRVEVEALEMVLRDVTRPYPAPSGRVPRHP